MSSSPPSRTTASRARLAPEIVTQTRRITSSPKACPCWSLTCFKLSMSMAINASGSPANFENSIALASAVSKYLRLKSPVSASRCASVRIDPSSLNKCAVCLVMPAATYTKAEIKIEMAAPNRSSLKPSDRFPSRMNCTAMTQKHSMISATIPRRIKDLRRKSLLQSKKSLTDNRRNARMRNATEMPTKMIAGALSIVKT